ncbi:MAG: hypothetical protein WBS54_01500 [Acidobacteriota bacterium]
MTSFRIAKLAALVDGWRYTTPVKALVQELTEKLSKGGAAFEGAPLPEETVTDRLPPGIKSAWVFVLKPQTLTPAHQHPNSVQYTSVIAGGGTGHVGDKSFYLQPFDPAFPELSVLVISEGTPHAFEVGNEHLVVLSFHTVRAEELVEVEVETQRPRRYIEKRERPKKRKPKRH